MITQLKSLLTKVYIKIHEHVYADRLRYLFINNRSDTLLVVFSGFSEKPRYNYIRTLSDIKTNKMFILDDFGYRGSYYWYENNDNKPMFLVKSLIGDTLKKGKYKRLITLGSSKGGTCAIYYGLMFGASDIYSGACQYYIGRYLNAEDRVPVFKAMMGNTASEAEQFILDEEMPRQINKYKNTSSIVHLLYSKNEHTYNDHIRYLIEDLDVNHIKHNDKIECFNNHDDVGAFFSPWIKKEIAETLRNNL